MLTPSAVGGGGFGAVWNSPVFDSVTLGATTYEPHAYASPLYLDSVPITASGFAGLTTPVVYAATSNGFVYAVKAPDVGAAVSGVPAGTILWRRSLGRPTPTLDGGVPVGVLSTPTIDVNASPPRMYVTSDVTDAAGRNWQVFALDLGSGAVLPGWPLTINNTTLAPINQNGPTTFEAAGAMSQRGALNLSPDGRYLYVPFGGYSDGGAGWLISVATGVGGTGPVLASAFAGAPTTVAFANGGMWGAGGVAVDSTGAVLATTGNSPTGSGNALHVWGNTLLQWNQPAPLQLGGTYTPWNYCQMDSNDTDLGGGSPMTVDLDPATTSTPHLAAFGAKQGNAYLVDRSNLPGSLQQRQPCGTNPAADTSLLPPGIQPQFGTRGPLNIFGPYSENSNNTDYAKTRTTPAYFRGPDGSNYLIYMRITEGGTGVRGSGTRRLAALIVTDLLNYRELFTADRVSAGLRPWGGATPSAIAGDAGGVGQNKTPPASDEVLQPVLAAALHLVNVIGSHAIELADQVRAAHRDYSAAISGPMKNRRSRVHHRPGDGEQDHLGVCAAACP